MARLLYGNSPADFTLTATGRVRAVEPLAEAKPAAKG